MGGLLRAAELVDASVLGDAAPRFDLPASGEPPLVGVEPWTSAELARLALDGAPDVGMTAPAWMLGPWVDGLDPGVPTERAALVATIALAAFVRAPDLDASPYRAWSRAEPRPDLAERAGAHAASITPVVPWRLLAPVRGGWRVEALVAVGDAWRVAQADLSEVGGVAGGPSPGGLLVARVVPLGAGAGRAVGGLCLPRCPSSEVAEGWVDRVARAILRSNAALRREEVLRLGGHHLVALAHRAAWASRSGA